MQILWAQKGCVSESNLPAALLSKARLRVWLAVTETGDSAPALPRDVLATTSLVCAQLRSPSCPCVPPPLSSHPVLAARLLCSVWSLLVVALPPSPCSLPSSCCLCNLSAGLSLTGTHPLGEGGTGGSLTATPSGSLVLSKLDKCCGVNVFPCYGLRS